MALLVAFLSPVSSREPVTATESRGWDGVGRRKVSLSSSLDNNILPKFLKYKRYFM